jgi:hypothetical protein
MKRTKSAESRSVVVGDMRPEYGFDYRKSHVNRFIERLYKDHRVVILDPDVSKVFRTSESVNTVLRALINTMPKLTKTKGARKRSSK